MLVELAPYDAERWQLRLASSELEALRTDWAYVAGPAPGHDFRRALVRAAEAIGSARQALDHGRAGEAWHERAREQMRAARRILVRRQLAHYARWWPAQRRYLG